MASVSPLAPSPATMTSTLAPPAPSSPALPALADELNSPPAPSPTVGLMADDPQPTVSSSEAPTLGNGHALLESIREMEGQMSEMRTKVYALQELRHSGAPPTTQLPSPPSSSSGSAPAQVDDLLMLLNTHLEQVSSAIPAIQQRMARLAESQSGLETMDEVEERWSDAQVEWEDVVSDVELLKEELKEDRWLVVFRTASSQAEEMMESLEKVCSQCYDLIHQVRRAQKSGSGSSVGSPRAGPTSPPSSWGAAGGEAVRDSLSLLSFENVLKSFEAKKKYYYPSVERVLSILDKGVRERVTKNGEVLLRHSSMLTRWRSLSDKLNRLGTELTSAHLWLLTRESAPAQQHLPRPLANTPPVESVRLPAALASPPASETGSSVGGSRYGDGPPPSRRPVPPPRSETPTKTSSRRSSVASSLARSMSPVQAMFGKMTMRGSGAGGGAGKMPKTSPLNGNGSTSYFSSRFAANKPRHSTGSPGLPTPQTDLFASTPGSSPGETPPVMHVAKPRWNGSTKPVDLATPAPYVPDQAQSAAPRMGVRRPSMSNLRGASGTSSPARATSPTLSDFGSGSATYRPAPRPVTPSRIPRRQPSRARLSLGGEEEYMPTSMMQRAHTEGVRSGGIQVPSLSVQPASEPSTSPVINGSPSRFGASFPRTASPPTTPGRPLNPPRPLDRSQTPDVQIRANAIRSSFYTPSKPSSSSYSNQTPTGPSARPRPSGRTSSPGPNKLFPTESDNTHSPPPSSFRNVSSPQPTPPRPRTTSSTSSPGSAAGTRPGSRAGAATPSGEPPGKYRADKRNPLDVEVARIVNGLPNGVHVERIDPIPKGQLQASSPEANTAQYAFFSAAGRKVVSCRLLELNRGSSKAGEMTKVRKVMVRVGGGWLDLEVHIFKMLA